jgi:hypothetical protein
MDRYLVEKHENGQNKYNVYDAWLEVYVERAIDEEQADVIAEVMNANNKF